MAETLKWPGSLKKQVNTEPPRKPGLLKIFITLLLTGTGLILIAELYLKDVMPGIYLFLFWIFAAMMITYGYHMFTSGVESESTKRLKGLKGEAAVAYELDKLPEGWYIINDIVIGGSQIDHAAVSPTGVFCLETKNWNNAGCDENGTWYHFHTGHWAPVNKNPAEQNAAHAASLEKFLNTRVHSIVVLANPNGKYSINSRVIPPGSTTICLTSELHHVLRQKAAPVLSPEEIHNIANKIVKK
ncbi:MAG: NERD domain-containing protein [Clostridiales bacterium]|nr:NERD domain-containing protein [Clostridiales bacterium]MCF8022822.1 NERD domain-containing protein [Clostridiales bacterium]